MLVTRFFICLFLIYRFVDLFALRYREHPLITFITSIDLEGH